MAHIKIIIGTVMGTALEVAQAAQNVLEKHGHTAELITRFTDHTLTPDDIVLVCTSNTGMGDLPENIAGFYAYLAQKYPAIAGMRYGVINLGDSSYPNFAEAGKLLDATLEDLGATRVGEALILDAIYVDDHEEEGATWVEQWQQLLN